MIQVIVQFTVWPRTTFFFFLQWFLQFVRAVLQSTQKALKYFLNSLVKATTTSKNGTENL